VYCEINALMQIAKDPKGCKKGCKKGVDEKNNWWPIDYGQRDEVAEQGKKGHLWMDTT
jgi:hypothetical protein